MNQGHSHIQTIKGKQAAEAAAGRTTANKLRSHSTTNQTRRFHSIILSWLSIRLCFRRLEYRKRQRLRNTSVESVNTSSQIPARTRDDPSCQTYSSRACPVEPAAEFTAVARSRSKCPRLRATQPAHSRCRRHSLHSFCHRAVDL